MNKILVFGHQNPDTDSICSTIAYANLKNSLGLNVEPIRLGDLGKEAEFVLNYFNLEKPRLQEKANDGEKFILIDHNEAAQSIGDRNKGKILEIIDHHKIDLQTSEPINMRCEAVGCSSTIISKIYDEKGVTPSKLDASLMLSAIISDTLLFKSPTCTKDDVEQAKKLATIAELDMEKYGMEMLIAGTDLSDKTAKEMYNMDMKPFSFGSQKATVAQVNTVSIPELLKRKDELHSAMSQLIKEDNLDFAALMITDIVNKGTELFVVGDTTLVQKTFGMEKDKDTVYLNNVVSRKKQIVPQLTEEGAK